MKTRYKVKVTLDVDDDANFWEVGRDNRLQVLDQMVRDALYDIDDTMVLSTKVEELD